MVAGWYAADIDDKTVLQGREGSFTIATAGMRVTSAELWVDGVKTTAGSASHGRPTTCLPHYPPAPCHRVADSLASPARSLTVRASVRLPNAGQV